MANITRLRKQVQPPLMFYKYKDSTWSLPDSLKNRAVKSMDDIIPDSMLSTSYEKAISTINSVKGFIDIAQGEYSSTEDLLRKNRVEWNRKFSLSFACIVLFMIGAPLGSIIRKGGLGSPLVFAVIFFVLFHLLNTFGEKFAKQGVTNVAAGMWFSTLILVPIGIFLTSKAMRDSQLFNKEFYFRFLKKLKTIFPFNRNAEVTKASS